MDFRLYRFFYPVFKAKKRGSFLAAKTAAYSTKSKESLKRRSVSGLHKFLIFFLQHYADIDVGNDAKYEVTLKKLYHYQKLSLALRVRKSLIPQVTRINKTPSYLKFKNAKPFKFYRRPYTRSMLLRFYSKRHKKVVRAQKMPRLKAVHLFVPTYLQRDFRTLRAVKIQSPRQEDIYYPFRISLAKRYSFYRAKGF